MKDALGIDRDDPDNTEQVKEIVRLLLYGCGCKSGCHVVKLNEDVDLVVNAVTVRMSLVSPCVKYITYRDE